MNDQINLVVGLESSETKTLFENLTLPIFLKNQLLNHFEKRNFESFSDDGHGDYNRYTDNSND